MTIVCGDSHTATHGAFGALAFASDKRSRTCGRNTMLITAPSKDNGQCGSKENSVLV